jgi:hypothetical protein
LEERLRVAQRPNGCGKARGKDTFERGDGEARPIPSKASAASERASDSRPEKPRGEQNSQSDLVAVEDLDQLAHEHDLADHGGESAERKRRMRSKRGGARWPRRRIWICRFHCYGIKEAQRRNCKDDQHRREATGLWESRENGDRWSVNSEQLTAITCQLLAANCHAKDACETHDSARTWNPAKIKNDQNQNCEAVKALASSY